MFTSEMKYQTTVNMITEECCNCGIVFGMPSDLVNVCKNDPNKYFYCPNGHSQHYCESTETKLRRQLENKQRELDRERINKIQIEGQLAKATRKLKRTHKRISNGVCPCCNRTFVNLQSHMKNKHPEYIEQNNK